MSLGIGGGKIVACIPMRKFSHAGREFFVDGFYVTMRDYVSALQGVTIARDRRKQLEA